jgi:hypothetical protein
MIIRKSVYGETVWHEIELNEWDAIQKEIHVYLDESKDWEEKYIGMHVHKNGKFLIDTNAGATVYTRGENGKFYCGFDGSYAGINDIEGFKEFHEAEGLRWERD